MNGRCIKRNVEIIFGYKLFLLASLTGMPSACGYVVSTISYREDKWLTHTVVTRCCPVHSIVGVTL